MASDPIAEYQQALQQIGEVETQVAKLVAVVVDGARKLDHWKEVTVVNSQVRFPAGRRMDIHASEWPSGMQLAETLASYHDAVAHAWSIYRRIPAGQRRVVMRPPGNPTFQTGQRGTARRTPDTG